MNKELISSVLQEFGITEDELQQLPEITQTIDNFFCSDRSLLRNVCGFLQFYM